MSQTWFQPNVSNLPTKVYQISRVRNNELLIFNQNKATVEWKPKKDIPEENMKYTTVQISQILGEGYILQIMQQRHLTLTYNENSGVLEATKEYDDKNVNLKTQKFDIQAMRNLDDSHDPKYLCRIFSQATKNNKPYEIFSDDTIIIKELGERVPKSFKYLDFDFTNQTMSWMKHLKLHKTNNNDNSSLLPSGPNELKNDNDVEIENDNGRELSCITKRLKDTIDKIYGLKKSNQKCVFDTQIKNLESEKLLLEKKIEKLNFDKVKKSILFMEKKVKPKGTQLGRDLIDFLPMFGAALERQFEETVVCIMPPSLSTPKGIYTSDGDCDGEEDNDEENSYEESSSSLPSTSTHNDSEYLELSDEDEVKDTPRKPIA